MANRDGAPPAEDDPLLSFAPVPHKQIRRNSIGPARQRKFIAALAATGIVKEAAADIGASVEALYALRQRPGAEGFRAAWDAAVDRGVQRIEDGALKRAIEGGPQPIIWRGRVVAWQKVHNEALVMFFLRQRRAARYGNAPAVPRGERDREGLDERCGPPELAEFCGLILQKIEALERSYARLASERAVDARTVDERDRSESGEAPGRPALPTPPVG